MTLAKLVLAITVSMPVVAQIATFTTSGTGCPTPTPPALSMSPPPLIGTTPTLTVDGLPLDTVISVLFVGDTQVSIPLDTLLNAPGCTGYVAGMFASPTMTLTAPTATTDIAIPNSMALVGSVLEMQALGASVSAGWVASDRGTLTIGDTIEYVVRSPEPWAATQLAIPSYISLNGGWPWPGGIAAVLDIPLPMGSTLHTIEVVGVYLNLYTDLSAPPPPTGSVFGFRLTGKWNSQPVAIQTPTDFAWIPSHTHSVVGQLGNGWVVHRWVLTVDQPIPAGTTSVAISVGALAEVGLNHANAVVLLGADFGTPQTFADAHYVGPLLGQPASLTALQNVAPGLSSSQFGGVRVTTIN